MRMECVYCIEDSHRINLTVLTFSATTPRFNRRWNQCTDTRQGLGRQPLTWSDILLAWIAISLRTATREPARVYGNRFKSS